MTKQSFPTRPGSGVGTIAVPAQAARTDFERIAIVNRGEAAMRLIHAAREFNEDNDSNLRTIAFYTEPDRRAMFVREADEAVDLGSPMFIDKRDGQRKVRYLDYATLERALVESAADAVWPGWGFVAERADFVDLCDSLGIVFIGPSADVMRRLGDKIGSKLLAERARVPVAPWSGGPVDSLEDAFRHAEKIGYPLMIKPTAGGGGRGVRKILSERDLKRDFESARGEALRGFGDPTVFMERLVTGAHHVEVQVIADHYGNAWAVGVRDCSVQRRYQKLIEESASPVLTGSQHQELLDASDRLTKMGGYTNAGTVEFLYQPEERSFSFMEVNARLQVEHPVTEVTTGLDLVRLQLHVARGGRLEGKPPRPRGHAIEVRLNAEDPDNAFAPAPGRVEYLRLPQGPGVRVDTGVAEGDAVPTEFDSLIAKIIAFGADRGQALGRLRRSLRQSSAIIQGGTTNKSFLLQLLHDPDVVGGRADVEWLDQNHSKNGRLPDHADVALLQAAIDAYDSALAVERAHLYTSAARGRPEIPRTTGHTVELRYRGQAYTLTVRRLGTHDYRIEVDDQSVDVHVERLLPYQLHTTCFGRTFNVVSTIDGLTHVVEVDGVLHRLSSDAGDTVRAPAPAVVVSVVIAPGEEVVAGDRLVVIEAMKNETSIVAPYAGRVAKVHVTPGVQVAVGAPLLDLKPKARREAGPVGERIAIGASSDTEEPSDSTPVARARDELRFQMLGFDVNRPDLARTAAEYRPVEDGGLLAADVLTIFTDICSLSSRRRPEVQAFEEEVHSPQEHLFAYLRALGSDPDSWPSTFIENLRRALAHYRVTSLDHTPELEAALFWICKSHQRAAEQIPTVMSILGLYLERADELASLADEDFRAALDRLIEATQMGFPAVAELAREVRYVYFDKQLFESARARVYALMEEHLVRLARHPEEPEREKLMRALVGCPQPMQHLLTNRFGTASPEMRRLIFEIITRRYYRMRDLGAFRTIHVDDSEFGTVEYDFEGRRIQVLTTFVDLEHLGDSLAKMATAMSDVPVDYDVVIDAFTSRAGPDTPAEAQVGAAVAAVSFPRPIRRLVVVVCSADRPPGLGGVEHHTYRPRGGSLVEDEVLRGIHPMMAKRLRLSRLQNFRLHRLPSAEDVYLFHGVAHENPRDERLFALAEVRDLTTVRDERGRLAQLPHFERALLESLAGIREFQSHRPLGGRVYSNWVTLYCWPVIDFSPEEFDQLAQRLVPAVEVLELDEIEIHGRVPDQRAEEGWRETVLHLFMPAGTQAILRMGDPTDEPIAAISDYHTKVVQTRKRGIAYPYEIMRMLTPAHGGTESEFPRGVFEELDLDDNGDLVPVERPWGGNGSGMIVGLITNFTKPYPEGMTRVVLLGDPTRSLGALAEPECLRIMRAIDLADERKLPLEWFAVSAGAKISMDSGTENMDWIARVLRRVIEFTQSGGEVNLIINGINVGAQPYWNAEATMLMHTRGILIMTANSAMVLTGKQSLDFSGSVSAEDNYGIGGYDRIMGPNGQGQYFAVDTAEACRVLLRHYEHTYLTPGERFPRRMDSTDSIDRDVRTFPHPEIEGSDFSSVGDIFSEEKNPGRKKPFDIRTVMLAVIDQDILPLERWRSWKGSETAVVWEAHIGGYPVCLLGIEGRPVMRRGFVPADGPERWTSGTLFPHSSKKVARAINGANGNRPVVVLANLTGFDGSPESMRNLQLEFGAEIGRAVVNFRGPIVLCVVSRYHGGAFVVFSAALNEGLEVAAVEGSFASVIGGAPAAGVVFAREVDARTKADPRNDALQQQIEASVGSERARLRADLADSYKVVRSEKLSGLADEFDSVHSIERAKRVGSVHRIIPAATLRPYLVDAIERGIGRELERLRRTQP